MESSQSENLMGNWKLGLEGATEAVHIQSRELEHAEPVYESGQRNHKELEPEWVQKEA